MNKQPIRNQKSRRRKPASRQQPHRDERKGLPCIGVLELHAKGYGFLRNPDTGFARCENDVFVSESIIKKFMLHQGVLVTGDSATTRHGSSPRLVQVTKLEDMIPSQYVGANRFDDRTPVNPSKWLPLERESDEVSMRTLDLLCPIGLGQRALIASPPRAGKTTLLKHIAKSISNNHPEIHLNALLIDERPEEVTEIREELNGHVFASCLDKNVQSHARLSQLVIDRCKRMAETGKDVFLIVDSLTRMARAFNKLPNLSGPIGAGGFNIHAFDIPKQVFASARSFKEGGSLTIVATVLIETENRMDEVIFQVGCTISNLRQWCV